VTGGGNIRSCLVAAAIQLALICREHSTMTEQGPPWPKQGPASYFPSIEEKYGRSIGEWQQIIAGCGLEKHMDIVGYLKSEYGMGHGHANALVGWTLAGNVASS
jgi:hypothetical protein